MVDKPESICELNKTLAYGSGEMYVHRRVFVVCGCEGINYLKFVNIVSVIMADKMVTMS